MPAEDILSKLTKNEFGKYIEIDCDMLIDFTLENKCMDLLKYISYEINEKTYYPTFEIKLYDIFNYHIDIFETYTENDLPFIEEFFAFIFAIDKIRNEYNIECLLERDITELLNKNQKIRLNIYKILLKCVCDLCYRHYGGGMGGYYSDDYSLRNALDIFRNIPIRLNDQEMFTHMCHFYKEHLNKYFENGDVLKEYIKYNSVKIGNVIYSFSVD